MLCHSKRILRQKCCEKSTVFETGFVVSKMPITDRYNFVISFLRKSPKITLLETKILPVLQATDAE